ncbi:Plasmin and fibronectin-binding protein A precursor [Paenibacillus konkukensis]|uniref:Plasmin and fibronectin-binding protein A n=1 Tax=Paenibacillus konkukensis TaxID=2020716 RepID=A0ABY4RIB7_9BACL|nr:right-handed parallel beta-helix repeat-containing protein [Paenibacillus konkukensis]UQZ81349.1 Plasmin and fibronectin-binding protein A precursor [Paenibacillus konkukensis]
MTIEQGSKHSHEEEHKHGERNHPDSKRAITRRKLLTAMGMTGVALASKYLLTAGQASAYAAADDATVTNSVYGGGSNGPSGTRVVWLHAKDGGAKGDGQTDDAPALLRLLGRLRDGERATLYFSKGSYRIGSGIAFASTLDLRFDNGACLVPDAGVQVTIDARICAGPNVIFAGQGSVAGSMRGTRLYPQWWGAKGDGTADDTPAIQAALSLAKLTGGVNVYLMSGVYKVTDSLRIYNHTRLELEHNAVVKRCHDNSFLFNGDQGAQYEGYGGHGNIVIEGGTWDGNVGQYPDSFAGLNIAHARHVTIRNTTIKDISWGHAIEINSSSEVLIEHCRLVGFLNAPDGSRNYAEAVQIDIPTGSAFPWYGKYDGTPSDNVTVRGCYFGASGTPGTTAWGGGVGNHSAIHDVWTRNIKIVDNTFDRLGYWAVRLFKFNDCLVRGNAMYGCGGGVVVNAPGANTESTKDRDGVQHGTPQTGSRALIADNIIVGTTQYEGISCTGSGDVKAEHTIIARNLITDAAPAKTSILITRSRSVQVVGNQVERTRRGIYAENTFDLMAIDNQIEETDYEGIWLAKGGNYAIRGNMLKRLGKHGIYVTETDGFEIAGNRIDSAGVAGAGLYAGIKLENAAVRGSVHDNAVRMPSQGAQNRYGLEIASNCGEVETFNNVLAGAEQAYMNGSPGSGDRFRLYAPDGSCYQLSVDNSGALQAVKLI